MRQARAINNMVFTALALVLLLATPLAASASAAPSKECGYVPRSSVETMLSELPARVTGWVSCYEKHPELSVFLVARFEEKSETSALEKFLLDYAGKTVGDGVGSSIVSSTRQGNGLRQIIVKTTRGNSNESTMHFAFEAKAGDRHVLYVQTLGEKSFLRERKLLDELKRTLSEPDFISKLQ